MQLYRLINSCRPVMLYAIENSYSPLRNEIGDRTYEKWCRGIIRDTQGDPRCPGCSLWIVKHVNHKHDFWHVCVCVWLLFYSYKTCSASRFSGNQVDGLPLVVDWVKQNAKHTEPELESKQTQKLKSQMLTNINAPCNSKCKSKPPTHLIETKACLCFRRW